MVVPSRFNSFSVYVGFCRNVRCRGGAFVDNVWHHLFPTFTGWSCLVLRSDNLHYPFSYECAYVFSAAVTHFQVDFFFCLTISFKINSSEDIY